MNSEWGQIHAYFQTNLFKVQSFKGEHIPSGKHTKNYGKSQFLMGKLTISMAIFKSFLYVYQRVRLEEVEHVEKWEMNEMNHQK